MNTQSLISDVPVLGQFGGIATPVRLGPRAFVYYTIDCNALYGQPLQHETSLPRRSSSARLHHPKRIIAMIISALASRLTATKTEYIFLETVLRETGVACIELCYVIDA